jgi:transposase
MNYKDYQPQQKELFGYRPEDVLEEGHLAFFIDEMVENLSIESFYDRTQSAGNPAYDPRIMLKLLFLGYAIGITSSRKLQHQCQENLAFIYLTRGEKPKFRAICEFRIKHSENIKELFPQMVQIAQKLNIVKIGRLILDGTKIRANANSKRTIKAEKYDDILKSIEDYLLLSKHQDNEEDLMYDKDQIESFLPKEILSKTNRVERLKEIINGLRGVSL